MLLENFTLRGEWMKILIKLILGFLCLPFYIIIKYMLSKAMIIEQNKIQDKSILILKGVK